MNNWGWNSSENSIPIKDVIVYRLFDNGCDFAINSASYEFLCKDIKSLKLELLDDSSNNLLNEKEYYLIIGGCVIYKGVYKNNNNVFPVENIPLSNLIYHEVTIYFKLPNIPSDTIKEKMIICNVAYDNSDNFQNEIDWPHPNEPQLMTNKLRFSSGLAGCMISIKDQFIYTDEYKSKIKSEKIQDIEIHKIDFTNNILNNINIDFIKPYNNDTLFSLVQNTNCKIMMESGFFKFTKNSARIGNYITIPKFIFQNCDTITNIEIFCPFDCDKPYLELFGHEIKLVKTANGYKCNEFNDITHINNMKKNTIYENKYGGFITNLNENKNYILKFDKCYLESQPRKYLAVNVPISIIDNIIDIVKKSNIPPSENFLSISYLDIEELKEVKKTNDEVIHELPAPVLQTENIDEIATVDYENNKELIL